MGIRGLLTYIKSKEIDKKVPKCHLRKGAHLHIDGNGYMFALLNFLNENDLDCSYLHYGYILERELKYLRDELGLQIIVYFDGRRRQFKKKTDESREKSRTDMWFQLYDKLSNNKCWTRRDVPKPVLLNEVFRSTLRELNIRVKKCEGEADQYMAIWCSRQRKRGLQSFCFADDSDFWLMKNIAYIRFEDLLSVKKDMNAKKGIQVWTRRNLAAALGFSAEEMLVEWGIALGNDFTGESDHNLFSNVPSHILDKNNMKRFDMMKQHIKAHGVNFKVKASGDQYLDSAITFSRMLYDLQDVSLYPLDDEVTPGMSMIEKSALDTTMSNLSEKHKSDIGTYIESQHCIEKSSPAITPFEVGSMVIEYWSVVLLKRLDIDYKGNNKVMSINIDFSEYINYQMLEALRKMLKILEERQSNVESVCNVTIEAQLKASITGSAHVDKWKSFVAAHVYQLSCKQFIRHCSQAIQDVKIPFLYDPHVFSECLELTMLEDSRDSFADSAYNHFSHAPIVSPVEKAANHSHHDPSTALPIDRYQDVILRRVARDRVTIIHGETGCGKSSRLPQILLENAKTNGVACKMMVSQPRRIAASSLFKRLHQSLGETVGLRMGHGTKHESKNNRIIFVTTGYLVRLLAHRPHIFDDHSHLIIDEVHERSVDGDVLCLLAKRLLKTNKNIRIVLMSATIRVDLYRDYFLQERDDSYGSLESLAVGARQYPIQLFHLENLTPILKCKLIKL